MARVRRSREISIFNFSFLDILACTVGALTFILVMVVVINIDSLPLDLVFRLEEMNEDLEEMSAGVRQWQTERDEYLLLRDRIGELEDEARALAAERERLETELGRAEAEAMVAEERLQALSAGGDELATLEGSVEDLGERLAATRARAGDLERSRDEERARADALARQLEAAGAESAPPVPTWLLAPVLFAAGVGAYKIYQHLKWRRLLRERRRLGQEPRLAWVSVEDK